MLVAGVSLARGLAAFSLMFQGDPALALRALGYFRDGDLPMLARADQERLRAARDRIADIPAIELRPGLIG